MKKIFVSQRSYVEPKHGEIRDALDQRWHAFFAKTGIVPLLVPNNPEVTKRMIAELPADGILLTGGNDTPEREASEYALLEHAIRTRLPVLGVCHGMQAIQRYFGVEIEKVSGHVSPAMTIQIEGKPATVNSYHELGATGSVDALEVWARADDGVVKAVRHRDLPITAIMWHPEREAMPGERDKALFTHHWERA